MDGKATRNLAGGLREAQRRFEQWRRGREQRGPIPEELWQLAVKAATVHGVHATARRLRLNPTTLKQRLQIAAASGAGEGAPRFVELPWPGTTPLPECILEAEDPAGRKLRIHLKAGATAQARSLGRMLWRDEG